jgi:hypothetical protein
MDWTCWWDYFWHFPGYGILLAAVHAATTASGLPYHGNPAA